MFKKISKIVIVFAMSFAFCFSGFAGSGSKSEAAVGSSYSALRSYMVYGSYGSNGHLGTNYWSCAGWVSRVLYTAGIAGELGFVPDFSGYADAAASGLEAFMKDDSHFELVATFNNGCGSDAADRLLAQYDAGEVKAGDIIIYYGYSGRYDNTWGREHAAIILSDKYNGKTSNTSGYGEYRWGSSYIGHPTIAHSMNYSYGVEFYTPIDGHFFCGDATGYAVYRLTSGKVSEETLKSMLGETEKKSTGVSANTYKSVGTATIVKKTYNGMTGWYYVKNNKVVTSYSGFAKNSNGWWYVKNGKVDFNLNGIIKGKLGTAEGWWYVKGGKVQFVDTIAKNTYGWWKIKNGKVDFSFTGIAQNENGWWYCRNGRVDFKYNGLVKYRNNWWCVKYGKIYLKETVARNQYGWWYCRNGVVDYDFNGFAQNENGWWYVRNGKVDFGVNDTIYGRVNGSYGYYRVRNGKVSY